ncbi:MAG: citrate (Si)-synthase [Acidobacteria bacterium]|nr:citrate (Si)-synthase [Acidobacteriota bacterium]
MSKLKEKLSIIIPKYRDDIKKFVKENSKKKVGEITIGSVYGGMRDLPVLVCDTSEILPDKGLLIRGIPVKELSNRLPEEVLWLLLTGELPNSEELEDFIKELANRAKKLPQYVFEVVDSLPLDSHPMTMLNSAIISLERESLFSRRYNEGIKKEDYWEPTYEDSLNIVSWVTEIAAYIYRKKFKDGTRIAPDYSLDWAGNFANMLGIEDKSGEFKNLLRLYAVIHSDNEGGNVSSHTCHCAASSLSNPFYAFAAGLCGLAGPLHGLANQEVLKWIIEIMQRSGGTPTEQQIREYAEETLKSGKIIPGYGHSILRVTDPRFEAFFEFGARVCPDDPVYKTVGTIFKVVPEILKKSPKVKDPYPNLDAGSGCLLHHFGMKEFSFYTVMFAVSRTLGMAAQIILSRGWGEPLESPKSMTTVWFKEQASS